MHPLKRARVLRDMSQMELAEAAGVTQQAVSGIERGKQNGTSKTLKKLAVALGTTVDEIIEEPGIPKGPEPVALLDLSEDDRRVLYGLIAAKHEARTPAMQAHDMQEYSRLRRALRSAGHEDFDLAAFIKASQAGEDLRRALDVAVEDTVEETFEERLAGLK